MKRLYKLAAVLAIPTLLALHPAVLAQTAPQAGPMPGMDKMPGHMENMSAEHKELMASMQKMNRDMMSGMMETDLSKSWAKQMIAHHQGAIDMAKTLLKSTKQAELRKIAEKTAAENQKDKRELETWLKKSGG